MRYYFEIMDNKAVSIVCQDESGLYFGGMVDGKFVYNKTEHTEEKMNINLPGKGNISVTITDPDYLEYIRLNERGSDTKSQVTQIFEAEGKVEEKIEELFRNYKGEDR